MTLCYIPLLNGQQIKPSALGLLEQAKKLNDRVIAFIVHCGINEGSLQLDCDEIHLIELSEEMWPIASNHIAAFEKFQKNCMKGEAVLFSASPLANEIAAGLALKLDQPIVNKVMEAVRKEQHLSIKKEIYGGRACLYEEIALGSIITYDPAFLPNRKNDVNKEVRKFHQIMNITANKDIKFIESKKLSWEEVSLTEATCVIGVGRGVYQGSGSQLKQIEELAKILNAPIGGSKVADELKLIPRERRIGSSGVSLDKADIYIAIGISGSSQHLAGIKNVKHVLAINNDAAAPIFKRADLGIVSDYEAAIPLLIEIIKEKSGVKNSENTSYLEASV